jgi:hypothetical protein
MMINTSLKYKAITIDNNPSGRSTGRSVREKKSIVSNQYVSDPVLHGEEEAL